ncbi:TonB-dependent receptor [Ascidiimonas sp. W6]|uniref:TonB-dependent receptor n=1 Tax=Ascidiimonas meishanensis TaxID=3128903 RepID=UPI0030EDBAF5
MRHNLLLLILFIFISTLVTGQQTGSIVGKITDKELNNDPLPFANVLIKGTTKGTTTDFDGLFQFNDVNPGTYILSISFIGYQTIEVKEVIVEAGKITEITAGLSQDAQALEEVVVTTTVKRESQIALLLEQKNVATIQTKIGATQLAELAISNVQSGLAKATGVATQGSRLYVRGLGDRYNNAYLNGLPLPSLDPRKKLIDLAIFPTNIVENLGIFKAYSSLLYGDFAGASVDINTKDNPGDGFLEIGLSMGGNSNALFSDFFLLDGGEYDYFGIDDGTRRIPSIVRAFQKIPDLSYDSRLVPIYQFETSLNPEERYSNIPNGSLSISGGKRFVFENDDRLDVLFSASFSSGRTAVEDGFETALSSQGGILLSAFSAGIDRWAYTTNSTLLGTLTYRFDENNKVQTTTLLINDTEDELREFVGPSGENDELNSLIRRGTFRQNALATQQLLGEHKFNNGAYVLNWAGAYNYSLNSVPDRRQVFFSELEDGTVLFGNRRNSFSGNTQRFWQELNENDLSGNISLDINFTKDEDGRFKNRVTFGVNNRDKRRNFEAFQLNYFFDELTNVSVDFNNPDEFLNQENFENELYHLEEFQRPQNIYKADLSSNAGFVDLQLDLSDKLTLATGVRVEDYTQNIFYRNEGDVSLQFFNEQIQETFFLPSLSFKYAASETTNWRLAASKTVTLPKFTETAPFLDEDIFETTQGNPIVVNSDNYNLDLKYEIFPEAGEIISFTAFGKYIENPIEKTRLASANNINTFVNTDEAYVAGIEFEYRQNLSKLLGETWNNFTFGFNGTAMYTEVNIDDQIVTFNGSNIAPTNTSRQLQGASPFIINSDLTYKAEKGNHKISSTLDFSIFGDRIYSAGGNGVGDIFEKGFGTLNFNFSDAIGEHWEFSIRGKNLLNPTIERYQDQEDQGVEYTVFRQKLGIDFSLGLTYKF